MRKPVIHLLLSAALVASVAGCAQDQEGGTGQQQQQQQQQQQGGILGDQQQDAERYTAVLQPVNESGVSGTAEVTVSGENITVRVNATGVEGDEMHPIYIRGFRDGSESRMPQGAGGSDGQQGGETTPGAQGGMESTPDAEGGVDSTPGAQGGMETTPGAGGQTRGRQAEGAERDLGPVLVALEPFPQAQNGTITYQGTIEDMDMIMPLDGRSIAIHGVMMNGEYDFTALAAAGILEARDEGAEDDTETDTQGAPGSGLGDPGQETTPGLPGQDGGPDDGTGGGTGEGGTEGGTGQGTTPGDTTP